MKTPSRVVVWALALFPAVAAAGALPVVLEVNDTVDVAKLEQFAGLEALTVQVQLTQAALPEPLVDLLKQRFPSRRLALPEPVTAAALAQAGRLEWSQVIVRYPPKGLAKDLAAGLKALKGGKGVVLPGEFTAAHLKAIRALGPAVLRYETEAGSAPSNKQLALLAQERGPVKSVRVLPNDGPEELVALVSGLENLALEVLYLPGTTPSMLGKLPRAPITLRVSSKVTREQLAQWLDLPQLSLQVRGEDLADSKPALLKLLEDLSEK
jgi:hypothetical protein